MALEIWGATCRPGNIALLHGGEHPYVTAHVLAALARPVRLLVERGSDYADFPGCDVRISRGLAVELAATIEERSNDPILVSSGVLAAEISQHLQRDEAQIAVLCGYAVPCSLIDGLVVTRVTETLNAAARNRIAPLLIHDSRGDLDTRRLYGAIKIEMGEPALNLPRGRDAAYPTPDQIRRHGEFLATTDHVVLASLHRALRGPGMAPIVEHWRFNLTRFGNETGEMALVDCALRRLEWLALDAPESESIRLGTPATADPAAERPMSPSQVDADPVPPRVDTATGDDVDVRGSTWARLQERLARVTMVEAELVHSQVRQPRQSSVAAQRALQPEPIDETAHSLIAQAVDRARREVETVATARIAALERTHQVALLQALAQARSDHQTERAATEQTMLARVCDAVQAARQEAASERSELERVAQQAADELARVRWSFKAERDALRREADANASALRANLEAAFAAQLADECEAVRSRCEVVHASALDELRSETAARILAADTAAHDAAQALERLRSINDTERDSHMAELVQVRHDLTLRFECERQELALIAQRDTSAALEAADADFAIRLAAAVAQARACEQAATQVLLADQMETARRDHAEALAAVEATAAAQFQALVEAERVARVAAVSAALAEAEAARQQRASDAATAADEARKRRDEALDLLEARQPRSSDLDLAQLLPEMTIATPVPPSDMATLRVLVRPIHGTAREWTFHPAVRATLASEMFTNPAPAAAKSTIPTRPAQVEFGIAPTGLVRTVRLVQPWTHPEMDATLLGWLRAIVFPACPGDDHDVRYAAQLHFAQ